MHRRRFLQSASAAALAACAGSPPSQRPSNVVFVLTDDQAPATLGVYGNPEIKTPYSDQLAREGAVLDNAFCTTPVCSPSRMTLMTGQIPSQHGVHDWISDGNEGDSAQQFLAGEATLSEALARNGYRCGLSGKWHMGDSATPQAGFDYWFAMPTGGSRYQDPEMYWQGEKQVYPGYATDVITDKALEFIDQSKDHPFFCFVSYNAPHTPYEGTPDKYLSLYRDSPFATFPGEPLNEPIAHSLSRRNVGNRDSKLHYYGMISAIDDNVGRIAARLDDHGLAADTLFIYLSDHGFLLEQHGLWGKGNTSWPYNMFDESLRVPAFFRQPGRIPGAGRVQACTSFYDFAPTVLDYLGLPPLDSPKPLPGRSYAPLLRGETAESWDDTVYAEYQYCRTIREPDWKLTERTEGFPSELYHLAADPAERVNLFDDPARQTQHARLSAKLHGWFDSLGCGDPDLWKDAKQKVLPSYVRPK
ncbi:MAG: sulfatase-like hydrolase/transferase [Acidobacteria bacterium]|nr:sulfatase-like hydrolase/transferase [Acidobacteriota bacterium]